MIFLWGMKDIALLHEMADESMVYCKQGKLTKFAEATHWIQHEEAEKVNKVLEDFFVAK